MMFQKIAMMTMLSFLVCATGHAFDVNSYYGVYDAQRKKAGFPSKGLTGPKKQAWVLPEKADKPYTIGVSFPHLKDSYWLAVNYGIISQAEKFGIGIRLVEAGGYTELPTQIEQVKQLAAQKVDGIILASISYTELDALVAEIAGQGIPVVEVINDIKAQDITGKTLVSFFDMGYFAGEHVAQDAQKAGKNEINVVFLPGPQNSGWAPDTLEGFKTAGFIFPGKINMLDVKWGDTGANAQSALVEDAIAAFPKIDYLVGNAVAAESAVDLLKKAGRDTKIVSTYIIPTIYDKINEGLISAAPSDLTATQGQMAVDMMVHVLNGKKPGEDIPFRAGPIIPVITQKNTADYPYEFHFGPRDFKPVFSLDAKK